MINNNEFNTLKSFLKEKKVYWKFKQSLITKAKTELFREDRSWISYILLGLQNNRDWFISQTLIELQNDGITWAQVNDVIDQIPQLLPSSFRPTYHTALRNRLSCLYQNYTK